MQVEGMRRLAAKPDFSRRNIANGRLNPQPEADDRLFSPTDRKCEALVHFLPSRRRSVRLYLSSFDLGARPEVIARLVGGKMRAAITVNALDHREEARAQWFDSQSRKLQALGFTVEELDLRQFFHSRELLGDRLREFDMIWVNGGNAFILRRAMRQSGFDAVIADLLEHNRIVYAGFSAAAVIASSTLRALESVSDPTEVPPGYDAVVVWDGLQLLPFSLVVHFESDHPASALVGEEIDFYKRHQIPYQTLKDGEAYVVDGARSEVIR